MLVATAFVVTLVGLVHFVNMTFDDAFVSFRYAENLASGNGLVFNPGERVEGYSNFLWTLLLVVPTLLGAGRHEFGMLMVAKATGALLALATVALVMATADRRREPTDRSTTPVAGLALALSASFLAWSDGGMETPLVTFLLLLAIFFALSELERPHPARTIEGSAVALVLAALTRPEPVILIAPFLALRIGARSAPQRFRHWRSDLRYVLTFAVPYALFLAFRWGYYGQVVPNTFFAKRYGDAEAWSRGLSYLGYVNDDLALVPALVVVLGCVVLARRMTPRVVLLVAVLAMHCAGIVYEGGDWMPANRLAVPVLPVLALLLHEGWLAARQLDLAPVRARFGEIGRTVTCYIAQAAVAAVVLLSSYRSFGPWIGVPGSGFGGLALGNGVDYRVARWMCDHVRDQGLLAVGEAGVIPYYTKLPTLDLFGLMDAHIGRLPGVRHVKFDADYVLGRKPEYVVLTVRAGRDGSVVPTQPHGAVLLHRPEFERDYSVWQAFDGAVVFRRRAGL